MANSVAWQIDDPQVIAVLQLRSLPFFHDGVLHK